MTRRRSEKAARTNALVDEAIDGIKTKRFKSAYEAAKTLDISVTTLARRMAGGKNIAESREDQQKLTIAEEQAIAEQVSQLSETGFPVTHPWLHEMAEKLRERHTDDSQFLTPLGQQWATRFLQRHPNLKTVMGRAIEAARLKEATTNAMTHFLDEFQRVINEYSIDVGNIYNFDESGFAQGVTETNNIIIDVNARIRFQAQQGRQEWTTVVECICADGSSVPPLVIFKGENLLHSWLPSQLPEGWVFCANSKGWTSNYHGLKWLTKCFEPATRDKADGKWRLLICDGHESHVSADFVAFCIDNRIHLLSLPPHTSHIVQPLDVGCFGPLKKAMSRELQRFNRTQISRLQKFEWAEAYERARVTALRPDNVFGGWRGAGLFPFRPLRILRQLPDYRQTIEFTPPPPNDLDLHAEFNTLRTPHNAADLHSANVVLNDFIATDNNIPTPVRSYIPKLTHHSEQVTAENVLLRTENRNLKSVMSGRKEHQTGKRVTLKGHHLYSTPDILAKLRANEKATADKMKKKKPVKGRTPTPEPGRGIGNAEGEVEDVELETEAIDPSLHVEMA